MKLEIKNNYMKSFINKYLKWIIIVLCLSVFFIISVTVYHKSAIGIDTRFYNFLDTHLISDEFTPIVKFFTFFGNASFIISLSVALFILIKDKNISLYLIINLCIIALLNYIIKNILQRERPVEFRLIEERGYSFPSGHSMVSLFFYGLLIFFICKYVKNTYIKIVSIPVLGFLIICIGISRIYLGVHYTTDVLAGFLISLAYLIFIINCSNKFLKEDKGMKESFNKFLLSFKYAFIGIFETIKNERNIKIHILAMILVLLNGLFV